MTASSQIMTTTRWIVPFPIPTSLCAMSCWLTFSRSMIAIRIQYRGGMWYWKDSIWVSSAGESVNAVVQLYVILRVYELNLPPSHRKMYHYGTIVMKYEIGRGCEHVYKIYGLLGVLKRCNRSGLTYTPCLFRYTVNCFNQYMKQRTSNGSQKF